MSDFTGDQELITPGTTAYFVLSGVVTKDSSAESDDFIQVSFDDLYGDTTANVTWLDSVDATAKTAIYQGDTELKGVIINE